MMNIRKTNMNITNQQVVSGGMPLKQGINTRDVFTPTAQDSTPFFKNIPGTLKNIDAGKILFNNTDEEKITQVSAVEKPQWRNSGGISPSSGLIYDGKNDCLYGGVKVIEEAFDPDDPIQFKHSHALTCFNTDGSIRWQFEGPDCMGGPVCDDKGNIYITSESNIRSFDKDGNINWHMGLRDLFSSKAQPVVSPEGTVFAVNKDDRKKNPEIQIVAVKNGKPKWTYPTDYWNGKNNSMLSGKDGSLYVAGTVTTREKGFFAGPPKTGHYFIGLNPDGTEKFKIPVKNWGESHKGCIAQGPDGDIYTVQEGGKLVGYSPNGKERFGIYLMGHKKNSAFPLTTEFPPVIDKEGNVYIAAKGFGTNSLICLDKDGNEKWRTGIDNEFTSKPGLTADGNIITCFRGGNMHVLNRDGELLKKFLVKSGRNEMPDNSGDTDFVPVDILDTTCDDKGQIFTGSLNWVSSFDINADSLEQLITKQEQADQGNYSIEAREETVTIGGVTIKKNRTV